MRDIGLFVLRLVVGGYMTFKHGLPKLDDSDGEYGKSFESLGFHPGATFVAQAGGVETASGALIALGLFGPLGPMLLLSDMIVAASSVSEREGKFDPGEHELEAVFAAVSLMLALGGYGALSLDRLIGLDSKIKPWMRSLSVGAAAAGAAGMLSKRN